MQLECIPIYSVLGRGKYDRDDEKKLILDNLLIWVSLFGSLILRLIPEMFFK